MTGQPNVPRFTVDEIDDADPAAPAFDTVDPKLARAIGDSFLVAGCAIICDGKTFRPFRLAQTKPGWWHADMRQVNVPE